MNCWVAHAQVLVDCWVAHTEMIGWVASGVHGDIIIKDDVIMRS